MPSLVIYFLIIYYIIVTKEIYLISKGEKKMTVKDFLKRTYRVRGFWQEDRPRVYCSDGFSVSVQGSGSHYCLPNINGFQFTELELGFPSEADELILEYAEDPDDPTETVYGYVPIETVEALVEKHGGIDHY